MAQERIEIHFKPKGDEALIKAIKILDVVTKELRNETSRYRKEIDRTTVSEDKRRKKGIFDTKNMRLQAGAFATLRSKLLLYSFAVGLASAALAKLTGKFQEQEKAEKKLSVALGKNISALKNYASGLQEVTTFGDEEIINAQALVAAYTDDEEQIKKATKATLDFAAAKGVDLATATDLIAKTMNSSTNALSRYGIEVEGVVGSTSRLDSITRSITRLYEGQAAAGADTLSGALTQMTNAMGDANEAIGQALAPTIIKIAKAFKSSAEDVREFFLEFSETELEGSIRRIEEMGGNADNLRLKLLEVEKIEFEKQFDDANNLIELSTLEQIKQLDVSKELQKSKQKELELEQKIGEEQARLGDVEAVRVRAKGKIAKVEMEMGRAKFVAMTEEELLAQATAKLDLEHLDSLIAQRDAQKKVVKENEKLVSSSLKYQAINEELEALKDKIAGKDEENVNSFLEFLDKLDSRLVTIAEKFAGTFGEMSDVVNQEAQERINATNAAADAEINALKKTRRFQKMSAEQQAKEEQKIRDRADKDNAKRTKTANKLKAAEFTINQTIKARETIMNTQTAFSEALGRPFLQALILAQGAAALGTILAQKPPKFQYGGLVGGRRHSQGGTLIEAEQGEFVMNRNAVDSIGIENLNRMNRGGGGAINVSFTGNVLSDDFIESEAIPKIREAIRRGADIGVS